MFHLNIKISKYLFLTSKFTKTFHLNLLRVLDKLNVNLKI